MAQKPTKNKLTKSVIDAAKPKDKRWTIQDQEIPGYHLLILPSGSKSLRVDYRVKASGKKRTYTVGNAKVLTADQARKEAMRIRGLVELSEDPAGDLQKKREIPLFKDFWDNEFADYQKAKNKASSIATNESRKKHLMLEFANTRVNGITENDVKALHRKISTRSPFSDKPSPIQANRVIALLKTMMNLCEDLNYREKHSNPCANISFNEEEARDRILNPDKEVDPITEKETGPGELERFLIACSDSIKDGIEEPRVIFLFLTILVTGARRGEIMKLKKSEVQLHKGILLIEDHKGRRKNKNKPKIIDLNSLAIVLIRHALAHFSKADCEWVFESHKHHYHPYNNLHKPKTRLLTRAGIKDFRIHDMRHTFTTLLNDSEVPVQILSQLLGHTNIKTTQGYIHPIRRKGESKSEAISTLLKEFLDLSGTEGNVVNFSVVKNNRN